MSIDYRYELKFVIDNSRLSDAMQWMYNHTHARERFKKRKVNTLYFDDVDFSSVRDNLAGISSRKKLRLRWYGDGDTSQPYFQMKIRNGRLGYKNSYPIDSLKESLLGMNAKEIASECEKEMKKQQVIMDTHLTPTLQVCYDREYYEDLNGVRITIDQNISFFGSLPQNKLNSTLFASYPYNVMEVKFKPHLKPQVSELMRHMHITPKRHSKYLVGLSVLGYAVYI